MRIGTVDGWWFFLDRRANELLPTAVLKPKWRGDITEKQTGYLKDQWEVTRR